MYNNSNLYRRNYIDNRYIPNDRIGGFFIPFILGGLTGGAVVGASRPRPIVANGYPTPPPYRPPMPQFPSYGPRPFY